MAKNAMHNISYGLYIVTSKTYKDNGCISNTAVQVTSSPNRVSVTINKANLTHDMILESGVLTVSILSEKATFGLFERFGLKSGRDVDKFDGFTASRRATNGTLYITRGTNAYISGRVCQTIDLGTHTMFIFDVEESEVFNDDASVTYAYYQANIKPAPKAVGVDQATGQTIWRCSVCGYEYVGEELPDDFECPWCHHPAADFVKVVK